MSLEQLQRILEQKPRGQGKPQPQFDPRLHLPLATAKEDVDPKQNLADKLRENGLVVTLVTAKKERR